MIDIPNLVGAQTKGALNVSHKQGQDQLRGRGSFFSRAVQWLSGKLPGTSSRVQRTNNAVRRFIQDQYESDFSHASINHAIDSHTEADQPITARQARHITLQLKNIVSSDQYIDHATLHTQSRQTLRQADSLMDTTHKFLAGLPSQDFQSLLQQDPSIMQKAQNIGQNVDRVADRAHRIFNAMREEGIPQEQIDQSPLKIALDGLIVTSKKDGVLANMTWLAGDGGAAKNPLEATAKQRPSSAADSAADSLATKDRPGKKKVRFADPAAAPKVEASIELPEGMKISSLSEQEIAERNEALDDALREVRAMVKSISDPSLISRIRQKLGL